MSGYDVRLNNDPEDYDWRVRCERCRRNPVSLPEFDVLCESCRRSDAAKAIRAARTLARGARPVQQKDVA